MLLFLLNTSLSPRAQKAPFLGENVEIKYPAKLSTASLRLLKKEINFLSSQSEALCNLSTARRDVLTEIRNEVLIYYCAFVED